MSTVFSVTSKEQLNAALSAMRRDVPPRHLGRRKQDTEPYTLGLLLENIDPARLSFPLIVEKSERPDFIISLPTESIGIEVVEAVHPDTAQSDFLRGKKGLEGPHFIRKRRWGEKSSHQSLLSEIEADEMGDGWEGNSPEIEWSDTIQDIIQKKIATANSPDYCRFKLNWLVIYDNLEIPPIEFEAATPLLTKEIEGMGAHLTFQSIFIVDEHGVIELTRGKTPSKTKIPMQRMSTQSR